MFFDDLPVGYRFETAEREMTEAEIIAFAKDWDPQPFHLSREGGAASPYGGLISSGFHTLVFCFVLELECNIWNEASMGSPGFDKLRWIRPVRPGDRLRKIVEVTDARPSKSKPDRGITSFTHKVLNQNDEVVMTYHSTVILARKPA